MVYQIIPVAKMSWQHFKPPEPHQGLGSAIMVNKNSTTNLVLKIYFPINAKNNLWGKPHC